MHENKNLVEEALIQMKNVEEAIAENAKGILQSTMKEEINQLVKESLSEEDDEVETEPDDTETDPDDEMDPDDDDVDLDDVDTDIEFSDTDTGNIQDLRGASDAKLLSVLELTPRLTTLSLLYFLITRKKIMKWDKLWTK